MKIKVKNKECEHGYKFQRTYRNFGTTVALVNVDCACEGEYERALDEYDDEGAHDSNKGN